MFLIQSEPGKEYKVVEIHGGRRLIKRLCDLGFTLQCPFTIIVNERGHGPILVEVRGTRVAIGNGMARRIEIEEV